MMNSSITRELLDSAFTYESYKEIVSKLVLENKTSGMKQTENNIYFTKLNAERLKRLEKTTLINDVTKNELLKINEPLIFLMIVESWCGDGVQNLAPIKKMCDTNPNLELKILFRDENENIMNEFLTNGAKSIPICLIIKKSTLDVLSKWGPRPEPAQKMMREAKQSPDYNHDEAVKNIQLWYAKDKSNTIQSEFTEIFRVLQSD